VIGLRFPSANRAHVVAALGIVATAAFFAAVSRAEDIWDYDRWMVFVLVPLLVAVGAVAIRFVTRNDVAPLTSIMIVAMITKMAASFVRYFVTFSVYGYGDATLYDERGAAIANGFHDGELGFGDILSLGQETRFMEDLTGLLYTIMGPSRLGGFVLYSWLSFWGLVLFHRAARIGLPTAPERRYALLVYFMPTLVFWPSSIGKEAVMLLGLGLCAYGGARILARLAAGWIWLLGGFVLTYMLRPHVAFVVLASFALALVFRRRPRATGPSFGPLGRLIAVVGLAAAAAFTLGQTIDRLLPVTESTGTEAVGELLDRAESGTAAGGSEIERLTPNSPLEYPAAVFSVLFRPTIFDASSLGTTIAAAETTLLLILLIASWRQLKHLPTLMFRYPYVLFCVVYTAIFTFAWSSFANLGALVRQRVQVWPFVLLLLVLPKIGATAKIRKHATVPARTAANAAAR